MIINDLFNNKKTAVAEVSKATLDRYVPAAVTAHGHADFAARQSKDDPTLRSYHKSQKHTAEKRRQGISRALDRMSKTEGSLKEFAPQSGGDSGNYFKELASAWYNGAYDSGSLEKGIKTNQDIERLLQRGIVAPDGKTRKYNIDYNSDFDGVIIFSDDYYDHSDYDDNGKEVDSRTGQPWGPYDYMEFKDDELDEGVAEGSLEANTPDPVVVIQDKQGKILDKINLSVATQKYKLGNSQNIKNQLAHQNYTTIGNYVVVSPISGQPQDKTTQGMAEASLGDYRKKAAVSQAAAKMDRFFGRDDPATVAAADQTIAKRERGLARAAARTRPYTPPAHDAEKYQRELTARYPNIDELVAKAEKNRDPDYEYAEGPAYYQGREAEHNYQRLKQIQRVIQGLNESLQRTHP